MTPTSSLLILLKNFLGDLNFSDTDIQKVETDLTRFINADVTASLVEALPEEKIRDIRTAIGTSDIEDNKEEISKFLETYYTEDERQAQLKKSTQKVILQYLEYMLSTMSDETKKTFLTELLKQIH